MSSSANSAASLVDAQINSAVAKGDSDIDELVSTYRLVDTTAENSDKAYTEIQSLMTTCKIDLLTCGLSKHSCRGTVACIVTAAAVKTDFERLAGWLAGAQRGGGGRATGWLGHSADPPASPGMAPLSVTQQTVAGSSSNNSAYTNNTAGAPVAVAAS